VTDLVRRIALAAAVPAALLSFSPAPAEAVAPTTPAQEALMRDVAGLTNEVRAQHGCGALTVDPSLTEAALRQANFMAVKSYLGHVGWQRSTFESRSRDAGYDAPAAENVAYGFSAAQEVMNAWMTSPPHRRNILNCDVHALGTGVQRSNEGTIYWSQVFGY
jgi:uncharacterized protein YkwD